MLFCVGDRLLRDDVYVSNVYFVVCDCISFVEYDLCDFGCFFKCGIIFNEDIIFSVNFCVDYNGGGCGEFEGIRVGENNDGDVEFDIDYDFFIVVIFEEDRGWVWEYVIEYYLDEECGEFKN